MQRNCHRFHQKYFEWKFIMSNTVKADILTICRNASVPLEYYRRYSSISLRSAIELFSLTYVVVLITFALAQLYFEVYMVISMFNSQCHLHSEPNHAPYCDWQCLNLSNNSFSNNVAFFCFVWWCFINILSFLTIDLDCWVEIEDHQMNLLTPEKCYIVLCASAVTITIILCTNISVIILQQGSAS